MDLTLRRGQATTAAQSRRHPLITASTGPVGVLTASCALAAGFLLAVADLVTRLG
jgi:hypothetical protein